MDSELKILIVLSDAYPLFRALFSVRVKLNNLGGI